MMIPKTVRYDFRSIATLKLLLESQYIYLNMLIPRTTRYIMIIYNQVLKMKVCLFTESRIYAILQEIYVEVCLDLQIDVLLLKF